MAFLKAHWMKFVFGLVCSGAIAGTIGGMIARDAITERLQTADSVIRTVQGLRSRPANRAVIEARRKENARKKQEFQQAEDVALAVQKYNPFYETVDASGEVVLALRQPLIDGILPDPVGTAPLAFRPRYREALDELLVRLHATDKPSQDQVRATEGLLRVGGGKAASGATRNPWSPERLGGANEGEEPEQGWTPLEVLRKSPASVASYQKAIEGYMYVTSAAFGRHKLADSVDRPDAADIWQAQMSLWIQQDIATALARCNEDKARQLEDEGRHPWVANLPVKHLKRLSIADQLGGPQGPGGGLNKPKGGFATSLTARRNNKDMFVVPLQLQLVISEAALPAVLEKLCAVGFYTPTNVKYHTVPPNPAQIGYIYGPDPVIDVVIDLEGYYFRKVYDQWIPTKQLKQALSTPGCAVGGGESQGGQFGGRGRG